MSHEFETGFFYATLVSGSRSGSGTISISISIWRGRGRTGSRDPGNYWPMYFFW